MIQDKQSISILEGERVSTSDDPQAMGRRWSPGSLLGLVRVVGRRLWSHIALMLAIAAGFVVAIALVVSIPVYAEAVGYRVLRDERQKSRAESLLRDSRLTIAEVGYALGYEDPANFGRACRRWFGASPSKLRERLLIASRPQRPVH